MKRCLRLSFIDNREPDEVWPLDDDEAAISCFSMLSQLEEDEEAVELSVVNLTDEEWEAACEAGEEYEDEDDNGDET